MCAYNRYQGKPCCSSDKLLIDILRNSWGYENIILSDCGAINDFWQRDERTPRHETHPDAESASADAVLNGTDLECGNSYKALIKALKEGKISENDLDVSLRRLLKGRFELGMFDPDERVPYAQIPYNVVESPEHVAQALEMAHKSMVLLKNKNNTLPLSKTIRKIAVVGPNAADSTMLWANYNGFPTHTVTILEGIRNKVPDTEVIYELGCNHAADFVIQDLGNHITSPAGQGFASEFYNNTEFKGEAVYKGLASQLHYTTGGNTQFAPNVNLTNFTARFTGEFEAPETEQVEIKLSGNDAFRLFIGDEKVAEVWENEYGAEKTYMLNAEKGKKYPVKIEYMQRTGSADLNFQIGTRRPVDYAATAAKVKDADVIVYVGGISPRLEGEEMPVNVEGFKKGDRTNIEIPKVQQEMVKALKATGKPVVYVLCTGSALALNWEDANIDAILNAWYGGQEAGTAVADILFGDYNPSGRLPVTFYKSIDQLPDFEDYSMKGRTYRYMTETPLYPFGYGLSYTNFAYSDLKADAHSVTLTVKNTGNRAGAEIVQLYIAKPDAKVFRPAQELKAFAKVQLAAGESKTVTLTLDDKAFRYWNTKTDSWEVEGGSYEIRVGASSADIRLTAVVEVAGTEAPNPYAGKSLPHYESGKVQSVPDAEWETLMGCLIPEDKVRIDRNMTLGELNHSRSPICWLVWLVLHTLLTASYKRGKPDLNVMFQYNMPLRALAKMTNGAISMGMVDGIVMEAKGFWIIGLCRVIVEAVKNVILNVQLEGRLRNS
jgi:beta-glucosidase